MAKKTPTPVQSMREKFRQAAEQSGLTFEEIGVKMGLTEKDARKAVSRLLNTNIDYDPRVSTAFKFAEAVGKPLSHFI